MNFQAFLWLLGQSGPISPDAEFLRQMGYALLVALLTSRVIVGPIVYFAARGRVSGREVWWGFAATLFPLIGGILFAILGGPRKGDVTGTYNPWVVCPWCKTPRGYSAMPCPRCGQFLPMPGAPFGPPPPPQAPLPEMGTPAAPPTQAASVAAAPLPAPPAWPGYAPAPRVPGYAPLRPPRYRPLDVTGFQVFGAILFAFTLASVAVTLLILPILSSSGITQVQLARLIEAPWFVLITLVVQDSIVAGVALDQALFRKRLTAAEMGLNWVRKPFSVPQQVFLGIGAGALTFVASAVIIQVLVNTLRIAGVDLGSSGPAVQPRILSLTDYGFWVASGVVVAPIAEELFFRGYALSGFIKRGEENRGLIITSVLFAAIHLDPFSFPALLVAGLVLGSLRIKTTSLVSPLAAHMTNNFIVMTLLLFGL